MQPATGVSSWGSDAPLAGLPRPVSRLIGRERELDRLREVVGDDDAQLVTLIGPGGIGKTRLALAVAHDLSPRFERVQFLPLVTVLDSAAIPGIIAARLGLPDVGVIGVQEALAEAFSRHRTLLVLDNLEHLPGASHVVEDLLGMPNPPRIIATSRLKLAVPGEFVFQVPPLVVHTGDGREDNSHLDTPATTLFIERVREHHADFVLTSERLTDIHAICAELDGLPLAIELAAARCRILTPYSLRQRLHQALDLLAGNSPGHAEHQRTIRRTIGWSVDLLDPRTRDVFEQLAVFGGSFTSSSVAALMDGDEADGAEVLDRLVEHYLVVPDHSLTEELRYRLPSAIREFAIESLTRRQDRDAVMARMAVQVHHFAQVAARGLRGPDIVAWTRRLAVEMANIVHGLAWLEEQGPIDAFCDILIWLQPYWLVCGRYDITDTWLERGLELVEGGVDLSSERRNGMYIACSRMALGRGDVAGARELIDRSGDEFDLWTLAKVAEQRGMVFLRAGDYHAALREFESARTFSRQLENREAEAWALLGMAAAWLDLGAMGQAAQTLEMARECYLDSSNAHGVALVEDSLSQALHGQGQTREALAHAERALDLFRTVSNYRRAGIALDNLGRYARELGDLERSRLAHLESCELYRQAGDPSNFVAWIQRVVALMTVAGDHDSAVALYAMVPALQERHSGRMSLPEVRELERLQPVESTSRRETDQPSALPRPSPRLDEAIGLARVWLERPLLPPTRGIDEVLRRLTRREREIVDLLVEGLTDQQIADRLGISIRTVGKHLSTAYARLGVRSRREAANLVSRG